MGRAAARILVVDDLDDVRETTMSVLAAAGYAVTSAASGAEALSLMAREPAPDLLLTDIVLGGGVNGFELAQRAVQLLPHLKILYATDPPPSSRHPIVTRPSRRCGCAASRARRNRPCSSSRTIRGRLP